MLDELQDKWLSILLPFVDHPSYAANAFESLVGRYSEEGRYYHTMTHVASVVSVIEDLAQVPSAAPDDPVAVELAGFFHDVVYDSRSHDNEEKSARLAEAWLDGLEVPQGIVQETSRLILLTVDHQAAPLDRDGSVLIDADLSILGAEHHAYQHYRAGLRREYGWMNDSDFNAQRLEIVEGLLGREHIYQTTICRNTLETVARANLAIELAELKAAAVEDLTTKWLGDC
jgi:predicted metal-dependent HD superfamily phosphohydrolase